MKKKIADNRGFTLVELIIVIAIIAVLAGVLAPQYIKYVGKSREAVCNNNLGTLREAYYVEVNGACDMDYENNLKTALSDSKVSSVITESGDSCTAAISDLCPDDGVCTITVSKSTSSITEINCSKHGNKKIESLSASVDNASKLQQAFSTALASNKITLSGGKFDSNGTLQTPIIKDMLTSMGYTINDNTMWKIVAKSKDEYCIYMADLNAEQMALLKAGKVDDIRVKDLPGTQVYYETGKAPNVKEDCIVNFRMTTANEATYCVITNIPTQYKQQPAQNN